MMTENVPGRNQTLIVKVQGCACALPLMHVIEMMRPLAIEPVAGTPSFVRGVSIIRGVPTPVVDLGAVLGGTSSVCGKFVTLRLGNREVALSVDAVLGVRELDALTIQNLPPLLRGASQDAVEAIGTLDRQMLVVLRAAWELPNEALKALALQERSQ